MSIDAGGICVFYWSIQKNIIKIPNRFQIVSQLHPNVSVEIQLQASLLSVIEIHMSFSLIDESVRISYDKNDLHLGDWNWFDLLVTQHKLHIKWCYQYRKSKIHHWNFIRAMCYLNRFNGNSTCWNHDNSITPLLHGMKLYYMHFQWASKTMAR